jgi:PAS domain S-box-containing protein
MKSTLKIKPDKHTQDFEALFNHATIGILAVDDAGHITMVNPFLLTQFGYQDEDELIGKKVEILIPQNLRHKHVKNREGFYKNPQHRPMGLGMELLALKKGGTQFPVEISLSYYTKKGEHYAFAFVTDISHRKEIEERSLFLNNQLQEVAAELEERVQDRTYELYETINELDEQIEQDQSTQSKLLKSESELKKSLEKEKELSELKSRFVSTASHEFRTPLSTILSSVYLLSKYTSSEDQPKRDKHIERIISSITLLTEILSDFLSVEKIEEGKVEVCWKEFNLNEYILGLISDMNGLLKKGQSFVYHHKGDRIVILDSSLLKHVGMNLISNAIKFSPENATLEISSSVENGIIQFSVKDKGIGISKDDQKHLFERFYRASNAAHIKGTGLGLHIVNKYVEMMNGKIICNSELEKGTEFIITFNKS